MIITDWSRLIFKYLILFYIIYFNVVVNGINSVLII